MKTKSKSTQVFEVRLWSKKYYDEKIKPFHKVNVFDGLIIHAQSKRKKHFHSPADFMKAIEELYKKAEKR